MKRRWSAGELADHCTLHTDEVSMARIPNTPSNQLGFVLILKWFQYAGQFPKGKQQIPPVVVDFFGPTTGDCPGSVQMLSVMSKIDSQELLYRLFSRDTVYA